MSDVTLTQEDQYEIDIWGGKSFALEGEYVEIDESGNETPVVLDSGSDVITGAVAAYAGGRILATFSGEITDGAAGKFRLELTGAQTAKVVKNSVYEVVLITDGETVGLWSGPVRFRRGII